MGSTGSAEFVAKNLDALANGTPLAGVVRNATFIPYIGQPAAGGVFQKVPAPAACAVRASPHPSAAALRLALSAFRLPRAAAASRSPTCCATKSDSGAMRWIRPPPPSASR